VVQIAIVRRFRDCPAGVTTLCLSVFMLRLIDAVALASLAFAAAVLAGRSIAVRAALVLLAGVGLAAAARQLRRCRSEALDTAPGDRR
jgi:hypothetical protein